jgi:hypothetical protein
MQQRVQGHGVIAAEKFNDHDRPPQKFSSGRVCVELDCGTRLSVYNRRAYCALHTQDVVRVRGRRDV